MSLPVNHPAAQPGDTFEYRAHLRPDEEERLQDAAAERGVLAGAFHFVRDRNRRLVGLIGDERVMLDDRTGVTRNGFTHGVLATNCELLFSIQGLVDAGGPYGLDTYPEPVGYVLGNPQDLGMRAEWVAMQGLGVGMLDTVKWLRENDAILLVDEVRSGHKHFLYYLDLAANDDAEHDLITRGRDILQGRDEGLSDEVAPTGDEIKAAFSALAAYARARGMNVVELVGETTAKPQPIHA